MDININKEDSSLNDFLIIFDSMKSRPSRVLIHDRFLGKEFNSIVEKYKEDKINEKNFLTEYIPSLNDYIVNEKVLIKLNNQIWISFIEVDKHMDESIVNEVCFFYKKSEDLSLVNKIISEILECTIDYEQDSISKSNTVSINNNILELEPISIVDEYDINNLYSDAVVKKIEKTMKKIKKKDKGLLIVHGERGIGKTNLSKYIANKTDRLSIFIPNSMIEQTVNNFEFKSFLKKFEKSLIIVDDCEFLYPSYSKINYFTNNVLQLIDGFDSDILKTQFLLIFNNEDEEEIDENLLNCNSLIDIIKIDTISPEKATELSKILGNNKVFKDETKLIDIFGKNIKGKKETIGLK
jgi:hypothetical protein